MAHESTSQVRVHTLAVLVILLAGCVEVVDVGGTTATCDATLPSISAEVDVGSDGTTVAIGTTAEPAAAFDGTGFLVVWVNQAARVPLLMGARTDAAGKPLGRAFLISSGRESVGKPAVAYNAGQFLVVWTWGDHRVSGLSAARVREGVLVGEPISIATGITGETGGAVHGLGTGFYVAWSRGPSLEGATVSPEGAVGSSVVLGSADWAFQQERPALASDGTRVLVVWRAPAAQRQVITGLLIEPSGAVVAPGQMTLSDVGSPEHPAVAWNGSSYLVSWTQRMPANGQFPSRVFARRVTPFAGPLGAAVQVSGKDPVTDSVEQSESRIAPEGSGFRVMWRENAQSMPFDNHLISARVDAAGSVLETDVVVHSRVSTRSFDLVSSNAVLFYSRNVGDVRAHASAPGSPEYSVAFASTSQDEAVASPAGTGFLVVSTEPLVPGANPQVARLFGARVDDTGTVLNSAILHSAPTAGFPALGFTAAGHLLTWQEESDAGTSVLNTALLDPETLAPLEPRRVAERPWLTETGLCTSSSLGLLTWRETSEVRAQWLEADGTARGQPFAVGVAATGREPIRLVTASDGARCLVIVNTDHLLVGSTGMDGAPFQVELREELTASAWSQGLAGYAGVFLLAWTEVTNDETHLRWARLNAQGQLLTEGALAEPFDAQPNWPLRVSAHANGAFIAALKRDGSLAGVRLSPDGTVRGGPFVIEPSPVLGLPDLAVNGNAVLATYARYDQDAQKLALRAKARWLPTGATCHEH